MNGLTRYYSVLGLTPSARLDTIKTNYRQLAKKFHPDTFTGSKDVSQRVMCDLNEAMRILSEAHARPFSEAKPVSQFHNLGYFENAHNNFKAAKIKKKLIN